MLQSSIPSLVLILQGLDMRSTITVVKKHAAMSVKNDASSGVEQISILIC